MGSHHHTLFIGIKHKLSIVFQLVDRLHDILKATMNQSFLRCARKLAGIPAFAQLFARGDIDQAIVQELVDTRHILGQEHTIHVDGVSGQRTFARRNVRAQELQQIVLGLFDGGGRAKACVGHAGLPK